MNKPPETVKNALLLYLDEISKSRSSGTAKTYGYTINKFEVCLTNNQCPPETTNLTAMNNDWMQWFLDDLRGFAPTTERSYLAPIIGFYEYVVAKNWLDLNLTEMRYFIKRRQRKLTERAQRFPQQQIKALLRGLDRYASIPFEHKRDELITFRDCALFHLLADSGLRVSEACSLHKGDVDWNEATLFVLGKGSKEAIVRISERVVIRLKTYLQKRESLDVVQKTHAENLPLFARHDKRIKDHILPMSARAVQQNIEAWVKKIFGDKFLYEITPHTFRHYFVTVVLRTTGGDVEIAKKLARHSDISTTMRYAHLSDDELDKTYADIFNKTTP